MKKRFLALFLALVMCLGLLPTAALAANLTSFGDVASNAWYHDAIDYVSRQGIMTGVGNNKFSPEINLTRAQLCQILYNIEKKPNIGNSSFSDVSRNAWYSKAVNWAASQNIVNGTGGGLFSPDNQISREQMVTILYRYAMYKNYSLSAPISLDDYSDANQINSWADVAMRWAVSEGIISGTTATTITPQGLATRAQTAVVLMRFCQCMETKEAFLAKNIDDFQGEEIINFDDSEETNFAVLEEGTVTSESSLTANQLISADEDEGVYVFSHVDKTISGLTVGDVLYHTYGDGPDDYVLVKVGSIEINGDTVTITEGQAELSDYFQYIDLDMEVDLTEDGAASVSSQNAAAPVVAIGHRMSGRTEGQPANSAPDIVAKDITAKPGLSLKFGHDGEAFKCMGEAKLTLQIKISYDKFIFKNVEISLSVKTETTVKVETAKSKKADFYKKETPKATIPVAGVIDAELLAYFKIEGKASAVGSVSGKITTENGTKYKGGKSYPIQESNADINADIGGAFNIKLGVGVTGSVKAIKILTLSISGEGGIEIDGKVEGIHTSATKEVKHLCVICVDGTIDAYFEINLNAKIGISDKISKTLPGFSPVSVKVELCKFYISDRMTGVTDTIEFGWGKCPHKQYLVTVIAQDERGKRLEGATVVVESTDEKNFLSYSGETTANGTYACYCDNGKYTLWAYADGYQDAERKTASVEGKAVSATLTLKGQSTTRVTRTKQLDVTNLPTTANTAEGWSWNKETKTLILDNVNFEVTDKPEALVCSTATIILNGKNTVKSAYDEGDTCAVYCTKNLVIEGEGSLAATSTSKGGGYGSPGISIADYGYSIEHEPGSLTINGGTITATAGVAASSCGAEIHGNLIMNGGKFTAIGGFGQSSYGVSIRGDLTVNGGSLIATTNTPASDSDLSGTCTGVKFLDGDLTMRGGSLVATGNSAEYGSTGISGFAGDIKIYGGCLKATSGTAEKKGTLWEEKIWDETAICLTGYKDFARSIYLESNVSIKTPVGGKIVTETIDHVLGSDPSSATFIVDASNKPAKEFVIE